MPCYGLFGAIISFTSQTTIWRAMVLSADEAAALGPDFNDLDELGSVEVKAFEFDIGHSWLIAPRTYNGP